MSIAQGTGNLLAQEVDALVNTVNTQGIMGKGIALQFKKAWPDMFKAYAAACKRGEVSPGHMHVWETGLLTGPRFIINFPTKRHWRARSKMSDIEAGLRDLVQVIQSKDISSIAIPPLGCGNGGLDWRDVEPRIRAAMEPLKATVDVVLFAPAGAPVAAEQPNYELTPNLTPARAALLALMREYERATFEPPSQIAVQKLAYFLQNSGQALRLNFSAHTYGPYADDLRKSLRSMEGHFITGFGDGSVPVSNAEPLHVRTEVESELDDFIAHDPETQRRVARVLEDISGFETAYGLELLATVHWVVSHDENAREDPEQVHRQVQRWNRRKATLFTKPHVATAWQALRDRSLVPEK